ncbi:MAG: chloride channel protein [Oscillospiraceae bacterium]|nr:chloride channel protein [Oscillospiraceae bacterium]
MNIFYRLYCDLQTVVARVLLYLGALAKWLFVSSMIGILCGALGTAFHIGVDKVTEYRTVYPWFLWLLPAAGVLIVLIYRLFRVEGQSTNNIISEVQSGNGLKIALIPSIFFSTILTHLCGGSAGREGAALQMGGTIGFEVGKVLRLDDRDLRTATLAGMAAFFSALFGTPLAASIFAMAVISVGLLYHAALIPCLVSSLAAYWVSLLLGVPPTRFTVAAPAPEFFMFLKIAALASLCAIVSGFFCRILHFTEHLLQNRIKNSYVRIIAGGTVIVLLSLLFPGGEYNGAGTAVIAHAVEDGQAPAWGFLLKILFTSLTLAAGFKGGEVVPCFFIGACFGCVTGPLLGIPAGFAAAIGMISVFCGAVNCPVASVFLATEIFGAGGLLYFALACALSFVLSGYTGLYSTQRILYDKLKAQYIDVRTNAYHEGEHTPMELKYR